MHLTPKDVLSKQALHNRKRLLEVFRGLLKSHGPRHWWPAKTRLEIIISAILTQNVSWKNAKKALNNLKKSKILTVNHLHKTPRAIIAKHIFSSRFYNQKSQKIKNFINYLNRVHVGSISKMFSLDMKALRSDLLNIKGIGKETADSILLYAGNKLSFVSDAYTKRFVVRYGLMKGQPSYDEIQNFFTS